MKTSIFIIIWLTVITAVYSQKALNIIPPSPNASSIQKFGEIPVSLYTGTPEITVPIFKINSQDFNLPITLKYHPSGIKVMEYASSVGLGWALNAGGTISRTINGLPDDCTFGFLNPSVSKYIKYQYADPTNSNQDDNNTQKNYAEGVWDSEPDVFYFNFNGYSGKFLFDQNRGIHIIPRQNLKIEVNGGLLINQFTITTDQGDKYIFSDKEKALSYSTTQISGLPPSTSNSSPCNPYDLASSWYLTKIITNSNQNIDFSYNSMETGTEMPFNFSTNFNSEERVSTVVQSMSDVCAPTTPGVPYLVRNINTSTITYGKRLTSIKFPLGKLEFIYNNARADLSGDKMLDEILILNEFDNPIKSFNFSYLYSTGNGNFTSVSNVTASDSNQDNLKLFLDKLTEKNNFGNKTIPPYTFSYEENVPKRSNTLYNADWWGYYNGRDIDVSIGKNPILQYLKGGNLKKIQYPTGGFTTFDYEKNSCQPSSEWNKGILNENQNIISLSSYPPNIETCANAYPCRKEKIFTISNNNVSGSDINMSIFLQCQNPTQCSATFCIYNSQNNALMFCSNSSGSLPYPSPDYISPSPGNNVVYSLQNWTFYLPNGNYIIRYSNSDNQYNPDVTNQNNITLKWRTTDGSLNSPAGGLRIKKISDYSSDMQLAEIKNYDYTSLDNSGYPTNNSSGYILTSPIPQSYSQREIYNHYCPSLPTSSCSQSIYDLEVNNFISPFPLATTNGSFVGYSNVIEYNNNNITSNGRSIYKYITPFDFPLPQRPTFPFILNDNLESARGLLKEKTDFTRLGYGYVPIKTTLNFYTNYYGNSIQANPAQGSPPMTGLRVTPIELVYNVDCTPTQVPKRYKNSLLVLSESYSLLNSTSEIIYNQNGSSLTKTTNLFYEDPNNLAITKKETTDTKGNLIRTNFTYPTGFASTSPYDQMISRNYIRPVIQSKIFNVTANTELQQTKNNFNTFSGDSFNNFLILSSSFQKSINGGNLETELTITKYDTKGNILETSEKSGIVTSYIWGHNSLLPLARVVNGSYDNVVLSSNINLTIINNPSISDDNLRLELNKLRTIPNCFVTTYTFSPLIGITSETDPNGKTKYYEYDTFNRLKLIRDQENNIIKKICYNYAGQIEDCVTSAPCTNTTANWQNTTTAVRCKTDVNGQYTGEQEQEQKDLNSCSPSYNTLRWIVIGTNTSLCPMPSTCNFSTCASQGEAYACIKGMCERGFKVFTSSTYDNYSGMYTCNYHYEYSDGTWSYDYSTTSQTDCYQSFTP